VIIKIKIDISGTNHEVWWLIIVLVERRCGVAGELKRNW